MDERVCTKVKFASEKFAIEYVEKLQKTSVRESVPQRAYFCPYCLTWHLTSKESKEVTQIKEQASEITKLKKEKKQLTILLLEQERSFKNFKKVVNAALNTSSHKILKDGAFSFRKDGDKNSFIYGANTMRELIKKLIHSVK